LLSSLPIVWSGSKENLATINKKEEMENDFNDFGDDG
jgi:hypothetical protein